MSQKKILGVRISPRQEFELQGISESLNITRSKLIRFILDDFIERYEESNHDK